jgi:lipoyl(octanoyl) transferase
LDIIIDKPMSGLENMQKDEEFFAKAEKGELEPTLRIYQWQPQCITLGYSQVPEKFLNISECQKQGWDIVKRITGGGIVFHNEAEITYSLFIDKKHPKLPKGIISSCNYISEILVDVLKELGIENAQLAEQAKLGNNRGSSVCFARPTKYEIVVGEKKIIGSAQKRGKKILMQHGSISIQKNDVDVEKCLKEPLVLNDISIKEFVGAQYSRKELVLALEKNIEQCFG